MSVLFRPRWLALHAFTLLVVASCAGLAWWQFTRAEGGNGRSLGYALQWPAIGIFGFGVWVWLCRDGVRAFREGPADPEFAQPGPAQPVRTTVVPPVDPESDPELAAYNAMLARLHERGTR